MIEKIKQVSIHEVSHFVIYLYMGGSADDVREMQLKPNSGYFDQRSFTLADNYFASSCLCLAGPVSDKIFGNSYHAKSDIEKANDFLRRYILSKDTMQANIDELINDTFQIACNLTESILLKQKETVLIYADEAINQMNAQNKITKTKLKKMGQAIINQWKEEHIQYFTHPRLVTEETTILQTSN